MEEKDARKLVAFSVVVYNLAGAFALYFSYNHFVLQDAMSVFFIAIFTLPITFIGNFYLSAYPDFWYPVILIQILILGITLYLADAMVRYFQR